MIAQHIHAQRREEVEEDGAGHDADAQGCAEDETARRQDQDGCHQFSPANNKASHRLEQGDAGPSAQSGEDKDAFLCPGEFEKQGLDEDNRNIDAERPEG